MVFKVIVIIYISPKHSCDSTGLPIISVVFFLLLFFEVFFFVYCLFGRYSPFYDWVISPCDYICIFLVVNEFKHYYVSLMTICKGMDARYRAGKGEEGESAWRGPASTNQLGRSVCSSLTRKDLGSRSLNLCHLIPILSKVYNRLQLLLNSKHFWSIQ